jgi:hypothetical protein
MSYISFQPKDYFNTVLYTGNASTNAITGVGFQPDWTWIKGRGTTNAHMLFDAVRGVGEAINSNTPNAEATVSTAFTAFDSDGFTVGNYSETNTNSENYVSWNWKANGSGSSNTDGSITSTVSANTTAGFSIVTYTGTGSAATVGHGLGSALSVIIQKKTSASATWLVKHPGIGTNGYIRLDATNASATDSAVWNSTDPTSTVFSIGTDATINGSGATSVAYCFAEKKGFSKFGSYTGNGSVTSPPFIYTGFKPAYVLIKAINATEQYGLIDNKRNTFNPVTEVAFPNSSSNGSNSGTDFLANGFAPYTGDGIMNLNSSTNYIYMAFAEEPLVASNGVPATAR